MLVPVFRDRTEKPPFGTPLRSDGHWLLQNHNRFYALNEFGGASIFDNTGVVSVAQTPANFTWYPEGLRRTTGFGNLGILRTTTNAFTWAICGSFASVASASKRLFQCAANTYLAFGNGSVSLSCNGLSVTATGAASTVNNKIYTIVCVYDGVFLSVIVNGVLVASQAVTGTFTFQSGTFNFSGDSFVNGTVGTYHWVSTWNTALGLDLAIPLSANPWQIYEPEVVWVNVSAGGPTSVYSGLTLNWDMFQIVISDLSVKWDLLNSVQSDLSVKFDMLNTVFANLSIPWDVYASINGDLTILFDTRNAVASDLQILWDSAGKIFSDLTVRWDLGDVGGRIRIIGSSFRRIIG